MTLFLKAVFTIAAALISGVLLFASFPPFDMPFLIWIALVPLFIALIGKRPMHAFFLSFVCSVVFFAGLFIWIFEVPAYRFLHHYVFALYLGPWLGMFGLAFSYVSRRWSATAALFSAPFFWVFLEYIRSNLFFLALPWGLLAHSQYALPRIIQIVSVTGVYGLSFLIVLLNSSIVGLASPLFLSRRCAGSTLQEFPSKYGRMALSCAAALLMGVVLIYGHINLSKPINGQKIKVSVVQGCIENTQNLKLKYGKTIMQTYTDLTLRAVKDEPSLIVWPEGSTPGPINLKTGLYTRVRGVAELAGRHLLIGSSKRQKFETKEPREVKYLNSAYLIPPKKNAKNQQYNKIRLLPFGEYLPLKEIIPWSSIKIPEVSEYVPGEDFTIFKLPIAQFGVTICWENVFSEMVRQFVKHGAQFIVNITNESWFGRTAAPYQFLSMSVFRAVENRIYLVRCSNTGISCFIDPCGRVVDRVSDKSGQDIFVRGVITSSVIPLESKTLYTRYGDWFAWMCFLWSVYFLVVAFLWKNAKNISGHNS